MKNMRNKFKQLTKIGVLLFGTIITFTNCSKEELTKNELTEIQKIKNEFTLIMKNLVFVFLIFLFIASCDKDKSQSEIQSDKKLIGYFITNFYLEKNHNATNIDSLTTLYNKKPTKKLKKKIDSLAKKSLSFKDKNYEIFLDIYTKDKNEYNNILQAVNFFLLGYRNKSNAENWHKYKVIHYEEIENDQQITNNKLYKNFNYDKLHMVYLAYFNDNIDTMCFFIIENNKIISFFPQLNLGNNKVSPYMLNISH